MVSVERLATGTDGTHGKIFMLPVLPNSNASTSLSVVAQTEARKKPTTAGPLQLPGIRWNRNNAGWDCWETASEGKERRQRHLGYLGKRKWQALKAKHKGTALREALLQWIKEKRQQKGNQ